MFSNFAFSAALLLLLSWHAISVLQRDLRVRRFGKRQGCQSPTVVKSPWPFGLDRIFRVIRFKGDLLDEIMHPTFLRLGTWTYVLDSFLGTPTYITADPENIRSMLQTNPDDWTAGGGARRARQFKPFLGTGILTTDGPTWEHSRAIVKPQFSKDQFLDTSAFERHLGLFLRTLPAAGDGWTEFTNVVDSIYRNNLDVSTEFLFGESTECQNTWIGRTSDSAYEKQKLQTFEGAFGTGADGVGLRLRLGPLYWVVNSGTFRRACRMCHRYVTPYVDKALRWRAESKGADPLDHPDGVRGVFLRGMASSAAEGELLRGQLLQLLFAGRDTTSSLVCSVLLSLARNPEAWQRLREEAIAAFGAFEQPTAEINVAGLKANAYLQGVLRETLRLYPSLPINSRQAVRDTILPTGGGLSGKAPLAIPAGTALAFPIYVLQRRVDIWGADAAEWRPERWLSPKAQPAGLNYIPFSAGPRHCPGRESLRPHPVTRFPV
jgi:cytochrome P450